MTDIPLSERAFTPCAPGTAPLSAAAAKKLLALLPGWELNEDATAITCRYHFKGFKKALALVNQVGELGESVNHHPDITLGWGYAGFTMQTHDIGGLHENDFIIASKINDLFAATK